MAPCASRASAADERRLAISSRRATHWGFFRNRRATAATLKPCSLIRERTTRASSAAVRVHGGELASSSRHLHSSLEQGASTTAGTSAYPLWRQASSRLKPSMSS